MRPWAGANGQRGRGRVRLFGLVDDVGLELPTTKGNVALKGLAFGVVCDLGVSCPDFQVRTAVANWFAKAGVELAAMGFENAYLEYGARSRLELFNLDRIFDADPRNDGDTVTFSTLPTSFTASVPNELGPLVAALLEPLIQRVNVAQNVAIVRIRPKGACGLEPVDGSSDIVACHDPRLSEVAGSSRVSLIYTEDSLLKDGSLISESTGVGVAAHELYHGVETSKRFNRSATRMAGEVNSQLKKEIIEWWSEGAGTAVGIHVSYGRFPRWDRIDTDEHPFWRIVRRDTHRHPGLGTAPESFLLRQPPLWNWGLAAGQGTTRNSDIPAPLGRGLPYRAWGFFLGGLRGDLGYLPLLLERFSAAFPDNVPFSNETAATALRESLRAYTGNPNWRIGHFMANAVELTGRSNSIESVLPDGENGATVAYSEQGVRRYLGNGAVNWGLRPVFGLPFLVSPDIANMSFPDAAGIVRALRPMAAQSIRFMIAGARRWRVECTDPVTKNDWRLQIRVGSAPIVPGGVEMEVNKWTGLSVGDAKDGVIEFVSTDYIDVDIMHVETNITDANSTLEKDWAYSITAYN